MPLVTSYTEEELATYMAVKLGRPGAALGLTDTSDRILLAVSDTARLLRQEVADVTDMALLEAAATWKAWEAAYGQAVNQYDVKAGSASATRSQFFEHLIEQLSLARSAYFIEQARADEEAAVASGGGGLFSFGLAPGGRGL